MRFVVFWNTEDAQTIQASVYEILAFYGIPEDTLTLVRGESADQAKYNLTDSTALIFEESAIDFFDIVFQWAIPPKDILEWMLGTLFGFDRFLGGCSGCPGGCGTGGCGV